MNHVNLDEYRKERLAESFDELAAHARAGEATGWTGTVKFGKDDHRHYALGDYIQEAAAAVSELQSLQRTLKGLKAYSGSDESDACNRCSLHHLAWLHGPPVDGQVCPATHRTDPANKTPACCPHQYDSVAPAIKTTC